MRGLVLRRGLSGRVVREHDGDKSGFPTSTGYSGDNDPVFDHLARVPQFDNALDRVIHKHAEPSLEFRRRLLQHGTYAF